MDLSELIQPGMIYELSFLVDVEQSTAHIAGGAQRVLSTPVMISYMEKASHRLLMEHLPPGFSSVGAQVNIRHLAPTPLGNSVRVRSEVLDIDGLKITFAVKAWDVLEQIGDGYHQRMVIDEARFLKRIAAKASQIQGSLPPKP
jgi:predicted thioesterase